MIRLREIVKRYPGVTALGGVSLGVDAGEIVGLIGENGAGKSTLMKVLGGIVHPDEGEILIDDKPISLDSVSKSTAAGIAFVHQELNPLDNLDIAGNVFLGREPSRFGLLNRESMRRETKALLARLGLDLSPDTRVSDLSLAQRQMVEIAKALSMDARLLILDEPTSSLTTRETERLLTVTRELRDSGVGIVYISHRLGEVKGLVDRVVGLKDGKNAGDLAREEVTHDAMVRLMVGRDLVRSSIAPNAAGEERLVIDRLRTVRYPESEVSLSVRGGEVFALAGLVGAGRTELVEAIFGIEPSIGGSVSLDGQTLRLTDPRRAIAAGIGLVPEDRRGDGLIVDWPIRENMTLPTLPEYASAGLVSGSRETGVAEEQSRNLGVKAPNTAVRAANLSGGNQQKIVLGKWLLANPKVLILDEPTRGVDVGAKAEIYALMRVLTDRGVAVLMVSSDMEEVLGVADRIGVMREGTLEGTLGRDEASEEAVMRLAVGEAAVEGASVGESTR